MTTLGRVKYVSHLEGHGPKGTLGVILLELALIKDLNLDSGREYN